MKVKTEYEICSRCGQIIENKYFKGDEESGWNFWYQKPHRCRRRKCPVCGSSEVLPHYHGTFDFDGYICTECGHLISKKEGEKAPRTGIGIKGWRTPDGRKIRG